MNINEKKIAIVTGAAGGFGREIVHSLLQEGFLVAATDTSQENLSQLPDYNSPEANLQRLFMDVASIESIQRTEKEILDRFDGGKISVLVNNAGIFDRTPILFADGYERMEKILTVNLLGTFYCTSIFARHMVMHKFGRIINISSIAGTWGSALASAYSASKGGMIAASQSWARELAPYGISVNSIAPGFFQNPMLDNIDTKNQDLFPKQLVDFIPVRRLGTPEDIAELVAFLATCKTNYLNGSLFTLDGGLHTGTIQYKPR